VNNQAKLNKLEASAANNV